MRGEGRLPAGLGGVFAQWLHPVGVSAPRRSTRPPFEEVWRTARPRVWGLAARLAGSTDVAEDLTQEVGVRALQAYDTFRGDADVTTWLYRITINVVRRHRETLQRQGVQPSPLEIEDFHESVSAPREEQPEERLLRAERIPCVRRALDDLPEELRAPLVLQVYEGLKCREIADVLEIPLGTVLSRLHAARQRLRTRLAQELGEEFRSDAL